MARAVTAMVSVALLLPTTARAEEAALNCPVPLSVASQCEIATVLQGQIVFVDPETGEVLTGEAAAEAALEEQNSAFVEALTDQLAETFSAEGLTEERTETGAIAVDLEGRFQNPLVATVGANGGITVEHFAPNPAHD